MDVINGGNCLNDKLTKEGTHEILHIWIGFVKLLTLSKVFLVEK